MPRLREQTTVRRPIDEAFAYTADFNNIENWDPGIASSKQTSHGSVGEGAIFDLLVAFGTRRLPMVYTITEYEPPHRLVVVGEGSTLRAVDEITFAEVPEGTAITYTADLTFKGAMKWIAPLLGPAVKGVGRRAVEGLGRALDEA